VPRDDCGRRPRADPCDRAQQPTPPSSSSPAFTFSKVEIGTSSGLPLSMSQSRSNLHPGGDPRLRCGERTLYFSHTF
jgi:hypothetical protein